MRAPFIARYRNNLAILAIVLLTSLVYANSLKNSFVFDDYLVIVNNNFVKSWQNLPRIFNRDYLTPAQDLYSQEKQDIGSGETTYRPVVTVSYFIDYFFWKLKPLGYHLTNLLLHIFNAILLYFFAGLITKNRKIALLASLLFALHPVNSEAVYVISLRKDLLAFLFFISSLVLYMRLEGYNGRKRNLTYISSLVLFTLALFSKEMAVTLPVILILYDYYFSAYRGKLREVIAAFKYRYLGYIFICLAYLSVWAFFTGNAYPFPEYPGGSIYTNILTMSVAIANYIKWILAPLNLHFILPDSSEVYRSFSPLAGLSALIIILVLFFGVRAYKKSKELSFCIFWFFATLLPVYNIVPIVSPAALRYLYIPMAGFSLLAATVLSKIFTIRSAKGFVQGFLRVAGGTLILIILVCYSVITAAIGPAWKDNVSMWSEIVKWYPENITARASLGSSFERAGNYSKAIEQYKIALRLNPDNASVHNALGFCYDDGGLKDEAVAEYKKAVILKPDYAEAYNNLCNEYISVNKNIEAINSCREAIRLNPDMAGPYYNIANAYANIGRKEEALEANRKAIRINPKYVEAYNNLAAMYADMGDVDKAIGLWNKAIAINPGFVTAHINLSVFYYRQGKYDLAVKHCDKAVELGARFDPEFLKAIKPYRK